MDFSAESWHPCDVKEAIGENADTQQEYLKTICYMISESTRNIECAMWNENLHRTFAFL